MPFDTLSLFAVCFAAVAAVFTWFNLQPCYRHHRFFDKEACAVYTIANLLSAGPLVLNEHGVGAAYPRGLLVAQLLGILLYLAFAVFNISRTNWALGSTGTIFQALAFCILPPLLVCWLAVRLCWGVLRFVGQLWAVSLAALPDDQWADTFDEDLKRKREYERRSY